MTSRSTPTGGGEHPTGNTSDGNTVLDTDTSGPCESATRQSASTRFTSADLPLVKVLLFFNTLANVLPRWLEVVMLTWPAGWCWRRYDRSAHSVEVMLPQSPKWTISLPDGRFEGHPSRGYSWRFKN
jgi:hypothetical protein